MLKRGDAPDQAGRRRGDWWKWKVVLHTVDAGLTHLSRRFMPFAPVDTLLRHRVDSTRALLALPERLLVLYSPDDMIIPAAESRALAALIEPAPQVVTFSGGHNMPLQHPEIWSAIERFLAGGG